MEATNEPNTRAVEPYLKLTILTVWFDLHTGDALRMEFEKMAIY